MLTELEDAVTAVHAHYSILLLKSAFMSPQSHERDLATLVVPLIGCVAATDDPLEPYRLIDADGAVVAPVASFLRELLAASRAPLTLRSYAMDLLRWWRFLAAADVRWEQATPVEGRDFSLWIRQASKPRSGPGPGVRRRGGRGRRGWPAAAPVPPGGAGWRPSRPGQPGDGQAVAGLGVCAADGQPQRDGAADVLRLSPGSRQRADGQPVPAGPVAARRAFACPSQPDGPVAAGAGRAVPQPGGAAAAAGDPG